MEWLFALFLKVKLCNGKLVVVEACREGFHAVGKRQIFDHNLVHLLRQCSRAFENVSIVLFLCWFIFSYTLRVNDVFV